MNTGRKSADDSQHRLSTYCNPCTTIPLDPHSNLKRYMCHPHGTVEDTDAQRRRTWPRSQNKSALPCIKITWGALKNVPYPPEILISMVCGMVWPLPFFMLPSADFNGQLLLRTNRPNSEVRWVH